jgi:hypothetical protein
VIDREAGADVLDDDVHIGSLPSAVVETLSIL